MPLPGAVLSSGEGGTQGGPALDTPNQTLASHTQHDQQRSGGHDEVGEANSKTENLEENNTTALDRYLIEAKMSFQREIQVEVK